MSNLANDPFLLALHFAFVLKKLSINKLKLKNMITWVELVYFGCTYVSKMEKYITSVSWFATFPAVSCSGSISEANSLKLAAF